MAGIHRKANKLLKHLGCRPAKSPFQTAMKLGRNPTIPWSPEDVPRGIGNAKAWLLQRESEIDSLIGKETTKKGKGKTRGADYRADWGFYGTWEWRKLRYSVLKHYGARCMCCGSTDRIVVDHIKPMSVHPHLALDFDNLQVLCDACNMGKSNDDETDWRPAPRAGATCTS